MKQLFTLILPFSVVFSGSSPLTRGADMPTEILKQIDQMKTDAEAKKDMPKELAGIALVTTEEAAKMWKAKSAVFLDNRIKTQFDTERIEGAQWFPIDELLKDPSLAAKIDKAKKYVAIATASIAGVRRRWLYS
jgi:hypothetical protein